MTTTPRILWIDEGTRPITGHVGSLGPSAFSLYQPEFTGDEWVLMSRLTGQEDVCRYGASADGLKPEAEALLAEFITSLGAIFPAILRERVQKARDDAQGVAYYECAAEGKAGERTFGQIDAYDKVLAAMDSAEKEAGR